MGIFTASRQCLVIIFLLIASSCFGAAIKGLEEGSTVGYCKQIDYVGGSLTLTSSGLDCTLTSTAGASGGDVTDVGDCSGGACLTADGTGSTIYLEGSTADTIEHIITVVDPTVSDKTFTFPNDEIASGDLIVGSGAGTFVYTAKSSIPLSDFNDDLTHNATAITDGIIVKADLAVSTDFGDVSTDGSSNVLLDSGVVDGSELADAITLDATTTVDMDTNTSDLNFDSNTLFIDQSTNRVGVGTSTPSTALDVNGELSATNVSFSGSMQIPNSATPTTDATAEIALDTTITDHQPLLQYYDGGENMTVIAIDTSQLPALDDEIIKYDAATDKFVLEADATGAGSGAFDDSGDPVVMNTTTKDVVIGTGAVNTSKLTIDGDADQVQLTVQGNGTQTDSVIIVETSAGTETLNIEADGTILTAVGIDAIGAVDMDYGSADVTDHTFTTDGTGDAEIVLPADSIGADEIDSTTGAYDFGGVTSFEIPNSATPTVDAAGEIALDTTITSYDGLLKYFDGTTEMTIVAMPTADLTTTDNHTVAYASAKAGFNMEAQAGGGGGGGQTEVRLPVQSAKVVGSFVTDGDATQGALISASDGNWRLLFDATTDEGAVWQFRMPANYSSAPVLKVQYSMDTATSGTVEFEGAIMCVSDGDAADIGTASFSTIAVASATVPGTAGYLDEVSITLTDDSCAAGDAVWVYLSTDSDDVTNDTATGDREVVNAVLTYTGS